MRIGTLQTEHVREANRRAVLKLLRNARPWSRRELAEATDLSFPTVAAIGQEFSSAGLVEEIGQSQLGGGRPAQLLQLVPHAQTILALDLSRPLVRAEVVDLLGRTQVVLDGPPSTPGLETALSSWLEQLLGDLGPDAGRLGYLTVAVPGVVTAGTGAAASARVRLAPALGWDDFPLVEKLRALTGLPVILENDVNAMTIAEHHYGAGLGRRHLLLIALGSGVGAGLVADGTLYRGSASAAGEIGYSLLPGLQGEPLKLGSPGPLERHLLGSSEGFVGPDGVVDLSTAERRARFERFAAEVHLVAHNLACLLNPEMLVVSWPADPSGALVKALQRRWNSPLPLELAAGALGAEAALRGAAHLALEALEHALCQGRTLRRLAGDAP